MVAFRINHFQMATLDDMTYARVLEAAAQAGGPGAFPALFSLLDADGDVEPLSFIDDLAKLAATDPGRGVASLIGTLRDDLMEALAAAEEG